MDLMDNDISKKKWLTNLGCWIIQSRNIKEEQVFKEVHSYNTAIVVSSETKKQGQGNKSLNKHAYFWSRVKKSNNTKSANRKENCRLKPSKRKNNKWKTP